MEPKAVFLDSVMLTRFGVEYVERKLEILQASTGQEKLKQLKEKFGKFVWEVLQNVAAQVLANVIQGGAT